MKNALTLTSSIIAFMKYCTYAVTQVAKLCTCTMKLILSSYIKQTFQQCYINAFYTKDNIKIFKRVNKTFINCRALVLQEQDYDMNNEPTVL